MDQYGSFLLKAIRCLAANETTKLKVGSKCSETRIRGREQASCDCRRREGPDFPWNRESIHAPCLKSKGRGRDKAVRRWNRATQEQEGWWQGGAVVGTVQPSHVVIQIFELDLRTTHLNSRSTLQMLRVSYKQCANGPTSKALASPAAPALLS